MNTDKKFQIPYIHKTITISEEEKLDQMNSIGEKRSRISTCYKKTRFSRS
jgi:hypothetical protein